MHVISENYFVNCNMTIVSNKHTYAHSKIVVNSGDSTDVFFLWVSLGTHRTS